jgi:hypothetical protein
MAGVCTRVKSKRQQRFATAHTDLSASATKVWQQAGWSHFVLKKLFIERRRQTCAQQDYLANRGELAGALKGKAQIYNAETARGRGGDGIPCVVCMYIYTVNL